MNRPRSIVPFFTCAAGGAATAFTSAPAASSSFTASTIAVRCRVHQRSGAHDVRLVHGRASFEELSNRLRVVAVGSRGQRRCLLAIQHLRIRAALQQKAHGIGRPIAHRREQQRGSAALRHGLHVGAAFDQELDLCRIGGRPHERRRAGCALGVDVGPFVEQQPHRVDRSERGRVHERCDAAAPITKVHAGRVLDEQRIETRARAAHRVVPGVRGSHIRRLGAERRHEEYAAGRSRRRFDVHRSS